jgi:hypothetical protein
MIALKEFFGLSAKILKAGLKETDSDRRPPPPMLIHQNNPMQSSRRRRHASKNNLTRRANQRHSFIIPQSCKSPSPRTSGAPARLRLKSVTHH